MFEKLIVLNSEIEIVEHFKEWKENINASVLKKTGKENISDYPDIEKVFELLQKNWLAAFKCGETKCGDYVELSNLRDNTKAQLETLLKKYDLNL